MSYALIWFSFRGRVSPRRATHFLLLRQKKVSKEKATPLAATPALRYGATCGARGSRGLAELAALKQRRALIREPLRSSAQPEGVGYRTGRRFARLAVGPLLRSASFRWAVVSLAGWIGSLSPRGEGANPNSVEQRLLVVEEANSSRAKRRPERAAERSDGAAESPSVCAEERSVSRIRARPCLSEASLGETPRNVSTAGCPKRSVGTQTAGSPFLCLRSFGEAKESKSPAGARPGLRPQQRTQRKSKLNATSKTSPNSSSTSAQPLPPSQR
ncbi:hypothetical protein QF040_001781 [Variovorax sp. W2I14]